MEDRDKTDMCIEPYYLCVQPPASLEAPCSQGISLVAQHILNPRKPHIVDPANLPHCAACASVGYFL